MWCAVVNHICMHHIYAKKFQTVLFSIKPKLFTVRVKRKYKPMVLVK